MPVARGAWVEVDTAAVARNVSTLKGLTPNGTLFMAVVKADGYGHGAPEVARAALQGGAERLGVATVEEALALRDAGVGATVHLLGEPPLEAADAVVASGSVPTVATREFAAALAHAASRAERTVPFHLKIDTGMNRIGVRAEEVLDFATWLRGLPGLAMEGAFTHFATADEPGDWDFDKQVDRFRRALDDLKGERALPRLAHAANSAATVLHPESHFDMVRCGIAIYGLHPSRATYGRVELEPAMAVKSRVSFVKRVGLGEGVSYGLTWRAPAATVVATLPLGYADGVHRLLSNRMEVLIGGRRCRQIGRVCMDQLMVEVPPGLEVRQGDEAVVVGEQAGERITMDEVAALAETINYEMACGFALRLERRYLA